MEAFKEYKEANEVIETKATGTISQFDRDDLETKHNEYVALRKAKHNIMKRSMMEKLKRMRERRGGVSEIEVEVQTSYEELKHIKDKFVEFPDDYELEAEVEAQKTKVGAYEECLIELIEQPPVEGGAEATLEETEALQRIKSYSAEQEAYTMIYNEAKEILLGGDIEEWEFYFEAIKTKFTDIEARYQASHKHQRSDEYELGIEFERWLVTFKAAMAVRFDLEEWLKREEAEMQVEVPVEDDLEIKTTIQYLVKQREETELKTRMQGAYDTMSRAEIEYTKEPENEDLTVGF